MIDGFDTKCGRQEHNHEPLIGGYPKKTRDQSNEREQEYADWQLPGGRPGDSALFHC